jgi:PAS domain S-box-containing protein
MTRGDDRFRVLVESIRDYAVFMLDCEGRVRSWNAGAALIKGYQREEIIGRPIDIFYTPEERESGRPAALLAQAVREGRVEDEGWRVRKDGTRFWADVVITALQNEAGQLTGFAKVTRDLTQRQHAEEERRRLEGDRIRAEEALRIRDEFLSVASHELKTPLTALQLELSALSARSTDERSERRLARAARSAQRLSGLIDMLLDVSRIAHGQLTLRPESFDLCDAVDQVAETMRPTAEQANCEFSWRAPGPTVGTIVGTWDRLRVEQVVMNLLSNAFKYAPGAPVALSVSVDGGEAVIEVRDHGPGVPPRDFERIFERFERASPRQQGGAGLGLGLYVSRQIAQAHGGSITGRNLPEGGAVFVVRLPLARAAT